MIVNAIMTWTQSKADKKINVILRMLNAESNNPAGKILENKLSASPKETQGFGTFCAKTKKPRSMSTKG